MQLDFDAMPTLGDIPRYHARLRPEDPAMTFEGCTIPWATLDAGANRVANALLAAGCSPDDRPTDAANVTYRQRDEIDVVLTPFVPFHLFAHRFAATAENVAMTEHHAFGKAGRAGRVKLKRDAGGVDVGASVGDAMRITPVVVAL